MNKKSNKKMIESWHLFFPKIIIIVFITCLCASIASAVDWVQEDWSGGADTESTAADPDNRTGWTTYYHKTDELTADADKLEITELSGTRVLTTYNDFYPYYAVARITPLGEWDKDDPADGKLDFIFQHNLMTTSTYTITATAAGYEDSPVGTQLKDGLIYPQTGTQGWNGAEASIMWGGGAGWKYVTVDLGRVYAGITSVDFYVGGGNISVQQGTGTYTLKAPSQIRAYVAATPALYDNYTNDASIADNNHWETVTLTSEQQGRYLRLMLHSTTTYLGLGEVQIKTTNYSGLATGMYISRSIDIGKNVSTWGTFDWTNSRAGGSVTAQVRFSADDSSWTAWTAIDKAGDLSAIANSAGKRYLQYRFDFVADGNSSPCINDVTITYNYYPTGAELGSNSNTLFKAGFSNPGTLDAEYSKTGSKTAITYSPAKLRTGAREGKYGEGVYLSDEGNALKNSNFSYYSGNNFTYWGEQVSGAATITTNTETKMGEYGASAKLMQTGGDYAQLYQLTHLKANTIYTLSFYVKADGDDDADYMRVRLRSYDADGTTWYDYNATTEAWGAAAVGATNVVDIVDSWARQSITFTTRDVDETTKFYVYLGKGSTDCWWFVDNVSLNETPGGSARMGWTYGQDIIDSGANDGLMALYHFDNNLSDYYGTNNSLANTSVTFDASDYKFGTHSAVFNAATDVASTTSTIYQGGESGAAITVEAWVKVTSTSARYIVHNTYTAAAGKWSLYYDGTNINFYKYTAAAFIASKAMSINEWHYVVGTYDGTNVRIYVDGVEGTPTTTSGNLLTNQVVSVGRAGSGFLGKIDELAIYSYAMTPEEINSRLGKDILKYTAASNLPTGQHNPGSIEMWVKPDWDGNDFETHYFLDMVQNDWDTNSIRIYKNDTNFLHFLLGDAGGTSYLDAYTAVNATNFAKGTWHHIVATWDSVQTLKLYLDGELVNEDNIGGSAYVSTLATYFFIGSDYLGSNQADAIIDDVRISDKEISAELISDYYSGNYRYVSNLYNTDSGISILTPLTWTDNGNDEIKMQLRTAPDDNGAPGTWTGWTGPEGTESDYYTTSGEDLYSVHANGEDDQWLQYRIFLGTDDSSITPQITEASIGYESSRFSIESGGANEVTKQAGDIFPVVIKYVEQDGNVDTSLNGVVQLSFSGATPNAAGYIPKVGRYDDLSENPDTFDGHAPDVADVVSFNDEGVTPYYSAYFINGTAVVYVQLFDVPESPVTFNAVSTIGLTTISPLTVTLEGAAPNSIAWVTDPQDTVVAGATWDAFSAEVLDEYENRVVSSTNTITITTDENEFDSGTASKVETSGLATFDDLTYNTANASLTVEASVDVVGVDPISDTVVVTHDDDTKQFIVENIQDMTAGETSDVKVTCQDQYANIYTDYTGTVHFTSTDPVAVLPSDYTFIEGDSGIHTFTDGVSLRTEGTHSVTVTDTVAETVTGTQSDITVTPAALTSVSVTLPGAIPAANGSVVGKGGNISVSFTVPDDTPIPADGKIVIEFGVEGNEAGDFSFDYQGISAATGVGLDGLLTLTYEGQTATITRAAGTAKYGPVAVTLTNMRNPTSWGFSGTFSIKTENSDGGIMAQKTDVESLDIIGVSFTTPTTGTIWAVDQDNAEISFSEGGTSNQFVFQYYDTSWHTCFHGTPATAVQGTYNDGGDTVYWDIPSNGAISSTYYIRAYDTVLMAEIGRSEPFAVSGDINITSPVASQQISFQTPYRITWTKAGTYSLGVWIRYSLDSTNGVNGTWKDQEITVFGSAEDAIAGTPTLNNREFSGVTTSSAYWLPSRDIGGGVSSLWLRIEDANSNNPPSSDAVNLIISDITSVNITLPGREGTAIKVGETLSIDISRVGVSNVRIEYKSKKADGYLVCKTADEVEANDLDTTISLPFVWKVPDDVYPDDGADIRVTATDTANISGALSKTSDAFIIYGEFVQTKPGADLGESYKVDDSAERVPIEWTGSTSISEVYFEYATTFVDPTWANIIGINEGQIYDDATEGTAGQYNWAAGSGTVWWQPKFTSTNTWVRVVDANDPDTYSVPTLMQSFVISGVSILGITQTSDLADTTYLDTIEVGTTRYIKGTGTTASLTVNLYYDTDPNFSAPVYIGTADLLEGRFAYQWTVADEISDSIYIKVTDPDPEKEDTVYNSTTTPISIKGVLTVDTPESAWAIGETDKTVTGTVTGDIDSIDLQYTTAADPQEEDWTDLATDISIGDNSGTTPADFTIAAGTFTVPDGISADSFKIRVKDSTEGRAADILAASPASNGFQVKGYLSVVYPTSSDDLYTGISANLQYSVAGSSTGDIKIYYGYRKGATASDEPGDYTWVDTAVLDTTNSNYMGTGVTPVTRTYEWTQVPDVVEDLIGTGADEQDTDVYETSGNECWMMIKVQSVNSDAIAYSEGFRVKYFKITWSVKNAGGGFLADLDVSEPAIGLKPQWSVTDNTLGVPPGLFDRYYPGTQQAISTTFSLVSGGINYTSEPKSWVANEDQTIRVTIDTSPIVVWDVAIRTTYDYSTSVLHASAWIQRQGLQLNEDQIDSLGQASLQIFDATNDTEPINDIPIVDEKPDENGVYWFSWDTTADDEQLVRGRQYLVLGTITFQQIEYSASDIFTLESATTYDVLIETVYDSDSQALIINTSLLEAGNLVDDIDKTTLTYCRVFDTSGSDLSGDLTSVDDTETDTDHAIFHSTWAPGDDVNGDPIIQSSTSYTIISKVTYSGTEYSGTKTFSLEGQAALESAISAVSSKVDTVQDTLTGDGGLVTTADNIENKVDTLTSTVDTNETTQQTFREATAGSLSSISSDVTEIKDNVGAILEDTGTTLPDQISTDLSTQLAKGVQSEILTRPTTVEPGSTLTVRYRTTSGLSPRIKVYDANNNIRVNSSVMSEIGSTGIYEYDLTIDEAWGLGDYTIVCSEVTTAATDSMVLEVSTANIDSMASIISALSTKMDNLESTITAAILPIADQIDGLSTDMSTINDTMDNINTAMSSLSDDMDTVNSTVEDLSTDVGTTITRIGTADDTSSDDTLFGKLAAIGENDEGQQTLVEQISSVSDDINATKEDLTSYINNVESLLGTTNDTATTDSIFGKIATLEANLAAMSPSVSNTESYSRGAREEATTAAETAAEIKAHLMSDDIEEINKAVAMIPQLSGTLNQLQEYLNRLPEMGAVDVFTDQVKDALKALGKLAADKGFDRLVPSADEFSPEDMQDVRNMVTELKAMMKQVRNLLDKEVNKPVVEGWLEESK